MLFKVSSFFLKKIRRHDNSAFLACKPVIRCRFSVSRKDGRRMEMMMSRSRRSMGIGTKREGISRGKKAQGSKRK